MISTLNSSEPQAEKNQPETKIIDCRQLANNIYSLLENRRNELKYNHNPHIAIVLVGNRPESELYVKTKQKQSMEHGVDCIIHRLPQDVSQDILIEKIHQLNADSSINGIILQLPLPAHLNAFEIIAYINPQKDADGLTSANLGFLAVGKPFIVPCTPLGCIYVIKEVHKDGIRGKRAVMIGKSNLVGKPLSLMLMDAGATVSVLHLDTKNIEAEASQGDILIVATGSPKLVKKNWVKAGATVIDVGINRIETPIVPANPKGYLVCGDTDELSFHAGAVTPVPSGIGLMTVAALTYNTFRLFELQNNVANPLPPYIPQ